MKSLPKIYNPYFLAIIATIGGMLFGFDISSISLIVATQQYINYFNNPSGTLQGGINASLAGGSVVGAIFAGSISNRFGRKVSLYFACFWWMIGTAVQVSTHSVGQLIVGRLLNGICVGIASSQVPVYLAEIAKKERRGSILVIQQLAIEVGILIMYFVSYGFSKIGDDFSTASFRAAWAFQWVPCLCLLAGLPFLPESPRWLVKEGRTEEAIEIVANIQARGDRSSPLVIAEVEEIKHVLQLERNALPGWRKYFLNGFWKRTFAGVSVQAWQQLSGANIITYYVTYIFLSAGLVGSSGLVASGCQYALFIVGTGATFCFIDFTGRRPLLIWGAVGMAACHFTIAAMFAQYGYSVEPGSIGNNDNVTFAAQGSAAYTVIAFCYILVLVYSLTLAPVAWVYAAEVWSLETRANGMGFATIANWLFNFALGFFIPPAFRNIEWRIYIIFGVLCIGAAVQAFFTYPETCGKSLEEIEDMFRSGGPRPWHTHRGQSVLDRKIQDVAGEGPQREHIDEKNLGLHHAESPNSV